MRSGLWAEAATLEARGETIRLDPSLYDAAAEEQQERTAADPIVEELESALDELGDAFVLANDLWGILGADDPSKRHQWMNDRLGETMKRLGFTRKQRRMDGKRPWGYERGGSEAPHRRARSADGRFLGWT